MKLCLLAAILPLFVLQSCKTATERWLGGLTNFKELDDNALSLQVMKMQLQPTDTTSFGYQVRIYPSKTWLENQGPGQAVDFLYHTDSSFCIRAGKACISPVIVQPVNNGIANCYEYLLYFHVEKEIRLKNIELVYADRFINKKQYALKLN
ncbi:MAG: hypothetical protein JST19_09345 [Bacteroidetes bacterium]|nr:hypothetical protein [Bacteroidota bacterium]